MRKRYSLLIASLLFVTGCAESYVVRVNGFAKAKSQISADARIYVATEANAANPIFESEVRAKIEALLKSRGYHVADAPGAADYRLAFELGFLPRQETYYTVEPQYFGRHPYYYGMGTYVPRVMTVWDQWLRVKAYRNDEVIWVGEAEISEYFPDKRRAVDYLIIGAFEYFGQDTAGQKTLTLSPKDPRIAVIGSYPG